jgi:predicted ATPase
MVLYHHAPQQRALALLHGHDLGVIGLSYTTWALWYLGYPDQALHRLQETLALAQELSHPHSVAFALNFAATLHQCRGEEQVVRERAAAVIALATEQEFPHWLARGTFLAGWAQVAGGQYAAGITQMRQGLAAWRATGAEIEVSYFLALLAEAYGQGGQAEEGMRVTAEALAIVHTAREQYYEAELYRLKGELLLARSPEQHAEADTCFRQALAIACRQQAKSLELRAAMSLARLWQRRGQCVEARELLAPIYGWFTEGFDTVDLREAKALLDELTP